jgi:hypothetical protein
MTAGGKAHSLVYVERKIRWQYTMKDGERCLLFFLSNNNSNGIAPGEMV